MEFLTIIHGNGVKLVVHIDVYSSQFTGHAGSFTYETTPRRAEGLEQLHVHVYQKHQLSNLKASIKLGTTLVAILEPMVKSIINRGPYVQTR